MELVENKTALVVVERDCDNEILDCINNLLEKGYDIHVKRPECIIGEYDIAVLSELEQKYTIFKEEIV